MKHLLLLVSSLFVSVFLLAQPAKKSAPAPVKNISITLTPLKNCKVYLGSYYGKGKILSDSATLNDKSTGVFKGNTKLPGGIYFVVSPQYTIQFELLIGSNQQFSIIGDTAQKDNPIIKGSADNDLFKEYTKVTIDKGKALSDLNQRFATAKTKEDSTTYRNEIINANRALQFYREDIIKKHPNSLLSVLLSAMKRPDVPAIPIVNGKPDSAYPYHFVKDHFWDDVNFNDDRLLHTPFFEPKLDDYLKYYISPEPDSIIKEVKYILLSARTGKEMYPYLLTKFTNKYLNPEYMGQDKVFLYLFDNFYSKGDTSFLNPASRKTIFERAYSMMANQLGNPAPLLNLKDTTEKVVSLYGIKAPITLIVFWDPTCGHCKEEIPKIDSIYRAKWKAWGVSLYAVNIAEKTMPELKKFVNEKKLSSDWIHVYQPKEERDAEQAAGQPNFRQLYDVLKTPTLYLLDEKKNIIAKQLSVEQFDDLIMTKLKKQNPTK
jgi:thiol-disulfide isomerase/thioredoxin